MNQSTIKKVLFISAVSIATTYAVNKLGFMRPVRNAIS